MSELLIGTGGVPLTSKDRSTLEGVHRNAELGLGLMELEFVHGVRMKEDKAVAVRELSEELNIVLTVHGPYYVNLASDENRKFYGSIRYITDSIYIGGIAGAKSVTFHPGFYQKRDEKEVFKMITRGFNKIYEEFNSEKYVDHPITRTEIKLSPELTGKPTQFGNLEELVQLANDFKEQNLHFCIDFAHNFARHNGKNNDYESFINLFEYIEDNLGREYLENLHMHASGIIYSEKGERHHVTFLENLDQYKEQGIVVKGIEPHFQKLVEKNKNGGSAFNWKDLLRAIKDKNVGGYLVIESPILELDALLIHNFFKQL